MAQTGVPFGATGVAQSFLQIEARELETPSNAHPKRPIEGMALERQESIRNPAMEFNGNTFRFSREHI